MRPVAKRSLMSPIPMLSLPKNVIETMPMSQTTPPPTTEAITLLRSGIYHLASAENHTEPSVRSEAMEIRPTAAI